MNSLYTICFILRHDFDTGITVGYISSRNEFRIHDTLLRIPHHFRRYNHPLLIPLLIVERMLKEPSSDYDLNDQAIYEVEVATGFHSFTGVTTKDPNPDYRQLAKQLGKAASSYTFARTTVGHYACP
jgi:hypothetical protein